MNKGLESIKKIKWKLEDEGILGEEYELCDVVKKELKALNEILILYDKWLGNEMSEFEFFTLLNEIKDKYGLSKEV